MGTKLVLTVDRSYSSYPFFRQLDLHFRLCIADVRRTIVIQASVNDTMPFILHEMKGRTPEIREATIDDLKVYHNDDLVNHDLGRYLHEVIDYEEDKPFYTFHVLIQARAGTNRPVMKKHLKKDQAVKELFQEVGGFGEEDVRFARHR